MSFDPNWIVATASSISAVGVYVIYKQLKADHERSRREKAVELIQTWAIQLNKKASLARKLVENLNQEQVRAIYDQEQINLDKKHLEMTKGCLTENFYLNRHGVSLGGDESFTLQASDSSEIRWLIVSYLNLLESILVAWHNGIADEEIIENQFQYLVVPEKGQLILEEFRNAAGGTNVYPSISAFALKIQQKKNPSIDGKSKVA